MRFSGRARPGKGSRGPQSRLHLKQPQSAPKNWGPPQARYLSGADHAAKIVTQGWNIPSENLTPAIKEIKPGVIEITTPVTGEEEGGERAFLFILLGCLGHAV